MYTWILSLTNAMVQLAPGFLFQNIFSGYEKSFGKLKYRTLSDVYMIISGVKNVLCSALLLDTILKPCLNIFMITLFMVILL